MAKPLELRVNGARQTVSAEADTSLLHTLREQVGLTGPKYGCGEGQCGACTVLINGVPRRSCITPAASAAGKQITTIEGLEQNGQLHPVQQAYLDAQALQCGYCTSGMILTSVALLHSNADPSDEEIVRFMEGNVCRCCAYPRIVEAIHRAAGLMKKAQGLETRIKHG
ncbi:MAG: (2Fe-2S)-binding protein [Terriglobia bacterium]